MLKGDRGGWVKGDVFSFLMEGFVYIKVPRERLLDRGC